VINLHTQANLAPWTFNDGKDIGIKMHYYDTIDSHAALVRANDTGYLEWYGRGTEGVGNVFPARVAGNSTHAREVNKGRVLGRDKIMIFAKHHLSQ
jgi:hypothetical protein